jgi:amino acid permease
MNKVKRIAAIIGLILFVSIFVILLISSFFATEKAPGLFLAFLFSALVIPIMIYMFVAVYKIVHRNDKQDSSNGEQNPDDGMDNEEDQMTEASDDSLGADGGKATGDDSSINDKKD